MSTIPDHHLEHTFGLKPAKTMNAAVQSAQRALGSDASISVVPNGSQVIPTITTAIQESAREGTVTAERRDEFSITLLLSFSVSLYIVKVTERSLRVRSYWEAGVRKSI